MSALQDFRKTVTDPTPFYAAVGLLDRAVDQVRTATDEAGKKALELREQFTADQLVGRAQEVANESVERVQDLPKRFEKQSKAFYAQAEESYTDLSKRGAGVIAGLRQQQEAQTQQFVEQGKQTAASARKVAEDAQSFATKTVLSGRKEVAKQVEAVAGTIESAADKVGDDARTEVRSTAAKVGQTEQTAAKKPAAKKAPAKRPAKKTAAKRTPAKKAPAKRSTAAKA